MTGARRLINDVQIRCSTCGPALVPCFAGDNEGTPVLGRYYCQRHSLQVIVLDDGVVIEVPNDTQPAGSRWADGRDVWERLGSAARRVRATLMSAVGRDDGSGRPRSGF
jgi:hypothetical protein